MRSNVYPSQIFPLADGLSSLMNDIDFGDLGSRLTLYIGKKQGTVGKSVGKLRTENTEKHLMEIQLQFYQCVNKFILFKSL